MAGSISLGVISGQVSLDWTPLSAAADSIKEMVGGIRESLASLGSVGADVSAAGSEASAALAGVGEEARAALGSVSEEASTAFTDLGEKASTAGTEAGTALKEVGENAKEAGGGLSGLKEGFSGLLENVHSLLETMLVFEAINKGVELVTEAFKGMMETATAMQQNQAVTAQLLKSTGDASGLSARQVNELAESISRVEPVAQDAVQSAENMLLTFRGIGSKGGVFAATTQAAVDMATVFNHGVAPSAQQVQNMALQLGKALNDPATGYTKLMREGVTFSKTQIAQIKAMEASGNVMGAQKIMLQELQREYGGAGRAAGKTFAGSLAIAKNQLEDAGAKILNSFTPALQHLEVAVAPLVSAFASALPHAVGLITPLIDHLGALLAGQVSSGVKDLTAHGKDLGAALAGAGNFVKADVLPVLRDLGTIATKDVVPIVKTAARVFAQDILPAAERVGAAIATKLLPPLTHIAGEVLPVLNPAMGVLGWLIGNVVGPAVSGIIGAIGGLLSLLDAWKVPLGIVAGIVGLTFVPALYAWATAQAAAMAAQVTAAATMAATYIPTLWAAAAAQFAAAAPILAIVAAIAAVIAIIVLVVTHWKQITTALANFGQMALKIGGVIKDFAGKALHAIVGFLQTALGWFIDLEVKVPLAILGMAASALGHVKDFIGNVLGAIGGFLLNLLKAWARLELDGIKAFLTLGSNILTAVRNFVGGVLGFIRNLVTGIDTKLVELERSALAKLKELIGNFLSMVGGWKDDVLTAVGKLVSGILGFFASLPAKMAQLGVQLIQGLITGITSMAGKVGDAIKGTVKNLPVIGGLASHIPGFATGSENTPAGLATLAEREPELVIGPSLANLAQGSKVIPLSQLGRTPALASTAGSALAGAAGVSGLPGSGAPQITNIYVTVAQEETDAGSPQVVGQTFGTAVAVELARKGRN